jgi:predicted flap endonuclease-1-like 5' DNA nuclease/glycosidase
MEQTRVGIFEFHVSRAAREEYDFDLGLFSSSGNVVFANFAAARGFAAKLNAKNPSRGVRAGDINAMGLIDEVMHALVEEYRLRHNPQLWLQALVRLEGSIGIERLNAALFEFGQTFPPLAVFKKELKLEAYLAGTSDGRANREILLEEMLMLWLENANPAFVPFADLFDDSSLKATTAYPSIISSLESFLEAQAPFELAGGLSLWRTLRMPALNHPGSLEEQLKMLLGRFGGVFSGARAERLGTMRTRVVSSLDLIAEEGRGINAMNAARTGGFPGGFGGRVDVRRLEARGLEFEPENFTLDREWMPNLVLIAKNAFVWLDQLSKKYAREIARLDQVPDEELDLLRSYGVTGLWLIGLWERSHASKEIKQRMGNADAVASAYSLFDYATAHDLGGEYAVDNLRARAWTRGIRLASDMVPNHVGIDGRWVLEHPEWFIQLPYSPFPGYSFNSGDLSSDPHVEIVLEDHYYDHSDAAVVFKRTNRHTGETRYLYHGNDGTGLPWNDTAQLDYTRPDVREAIIQTILQVAKQFPVIRFDAAMTLAKKHIQRLWFPEPGSNEGVASRAEFGMTKEEFDALVPLEFWREVVDRCAVEAPDTLLLAEAFWMMEGYFVRSLGMHRVYNSAFMNMLRDEKNGEYLEIIKNTLEFEPEILKRFVNFMNNPDEKTAVEQFGKGDKYFGVATLMATLPGLPMLGHGQIEGYAEKYGMEYRRAYYDETPDGGLVGYHGSQIFPLFKKRHLFADTQNFALFDFGHSVYAYSNRVGSERALVVFNNSARHVSGNVKHGITGRKQTVSLPGALGVNASRQHFLIYRDLVSNLEFIRNAEDIAQVGLHLELPAYARAVMLDWQEVYDTDGRYQKVAQMLGGHGVSSVEHATRELYLEPILTPWNALMNAETFRALANKPTTLFYGELEMKAKAFIDGIESFAGKDFDGGSYAKTVRANLEALQNPQPMLIAWILTRGIAPSAAQSRVWLDEYLLAASVERTLGELGQTDAWGGVQRLKLLVSVQVSLEKPNTADALLAAWTADSDASAALGMNTFEGTVYLNKQQLEASLDDALEIAAFLGTQKEFVPIATGLKRDAEKAGYKLELLMNLKKVARAKTVGAKSPTTKMKPVTTSKKAVPAVPSSEAKTKPKPTTASTSKTKNPVGTKSLAPLQDTKPKSKKTATKPAATPKKSASVTVPVLETKLKKPAPKLEPKKTVGKPSSSDPKSKKSGKTSSGTTKAVATPKPTQPSSRKTPDDLARIEGIGPKFAAALQAGGIGSFVLLSKAKPAKLEKILTEAGMRKPASLETWAGQAALLASGDESGFASLTTDLTAGRVKSR